MGNTQQPEIDQQETSDNKAVTTWNGALSYSTTKKPIVDLFFKSVRTIECTDYKCTDKKVRKVPTLTQLFEGGDWEEAPTSWDDIPAVDCQDNPIVSATASVIDNSLESLFDKAYAENKEQALKFLFHLRDCREGKGEKKLFRALVRHLLIDRSETLVLNMQHIPTFGSWKDVSLCFFGTPLESLAITLIADQLTVDMVSATPSLCAKYAPSEGSSVDKAHKAARKIAAAMGQTLIQYRKQCLTPLRAKLNIVERNMCASEWNTIKYEAVPSLASTRYKKAFKLHDEERYVEYLSQVKKGTKKMNTSVMMPHQIIAPYLKTNKADEHTEAQWEAFTDDRKKKWKKGFNILPLIDVSGSMFNGSNPSPVEVAVALGMLFAELNTSTNYHNKFITFDAVPELLEIKGNTLLEKVKGVQNSRWGGTTNFQSAFDLILNCAKMFNVKQEDMPQILIVLSDMQFNQADGRNSTNWEKIDRKFQESGYTRPIIVFWNLSGQTIDYPVPHADVPNCMLLSGYNDNIFYSIMDCKLPSPADMVEAILSAERYNVIRGQGCGC